VGLPVSIHLPAIRGSGTTFDFGLVTDSASLSRRTPAPRVHGCDRAVRNVIWLRPCSDPELLILAESVAHELDA